MDKNKISKKMKDISNCKFGRLTALYAVGRTKEGGAIWHCICECGNETNVDSHSLVRKHTKSCGCLGQENLKTMYDKLREKDFKENTRLSLLTSKNPKTNKTGTKGVFKTECNTYYAYINFKKRRISLGTYKTLGEAVKARKDAEEKYYKPFLKKYNAQNKEEEEIEL